MNEAEIYWMEYFDSIKFGYNLREGGSNGRPSDETRRKIGAASLGRKFTKDHSDKIGAFWRGKKKSAEQKKKISMSHLGLKVGPQSVETRAKISASLKGIPRPEDVRLKLSISMGGRSFFCPETSAVYQNLNEVARLLHLVPSSIRKVLRGKMHQTGGYTFKYIEGA